MQLRNRLNAMMVSKTNAPGFYADGGNLYLQIGRSGGKSWIFRYQLKQKTHDIGLGASRDVSLADARLRAAECRRLCNQGIDPLEARTEIKVAAKLDAESAAAPPKTFEQCAKEYIDAR